MVHSLPMLENGDRLSPAEFRRRYELRPDLKKAELIAGVVHVASPVRINEHGEPHAILAGELTNYRRSVRGVRLADNTTVRFNDGSEVQPDLLLRHTARTGGRSIVDSEHYVIGAPELCAEVAASSASYDLHDKKDLYRRHGVQEYIVWRVDDEQIDWWRLRDGEYEVLEPSADGLTRSEVFPGLALDLAALTAELRALWSTDGPGS